MTLSFHGAAHANEYRRNLRGVILLTLLPITLLPVTAQAQDGFSFCAAPAHPPCVDQADTYQTKENIAACQSRLDAFLANVVKYRDCLLGEARRTVLELNNSKDKFRCSTDKKRLCEK
jgi:hypothetical protein